MHFVEQKSDVCDKILMLQYKTDLKMFVITTFWVYKLVVIIQSTLYITLLACIILPHI